MVNWPAELRFLRTRLACVVIDISCTGACIRAEGVPDGVGELKLILASGPPIAASLAWRDRDRFGLRFAAEQDWIGGIGVRRIDWAAPGRQP